MIESESDHNPAVNSEESILQRSKVSILSEMLTSLGQSQQSLSTLDLATEYFGKDEVGYGASDQLYLRTSSLKPLYRIGASPRRGQRSSSNSSSDSDLGNSSDYPSRLDDGNLSYRNEPPASPAASLRMSHQSFSSPIRGGETSSTVFSPFSPELSHVSKHTTEMFLSREDFANKLLKDEYNKKQRGILSAAEKPTIDRSTR